MWCRKYAKRRATSVRRDVRHKADGQPFLPTARGSSPPLEAISDADGQALRPEIGRRKAERGLRGAGRLQRWVVAPRHRLRRIDVAIDLIARPRHVAGVKQRIS